ncbi:MAG TPA: metallophosphoesterase family protein [Frankiaceae bacterium]|jgi:hypothetical protein|nr:metallophosphoesterase family protein [Frankiaceae bacterium]
METPYGTLPDLPAGRLTMAEADAILRRNVVTRRRLLRGALVAAATGPVLWSKPGIAAVAPSGEHLVFGADASREVVVSWSTPANVARPFLDLGRDRAYGLTFAAESRAVAAGGTVYHHVRLPALAPDTTYHYRVRHAGGSTAGRTFRTAAGVPRPFRFTAFGDQGTSPAAVTTMSRVVALKPAFHVVAGDLCYAAAGGSGRPDDSADPAVWDRWFAMNRAATATTPWMPAVGNHDMEYGEGAHGYGGFHSRFALPRNGAGGAPHTYWFRYGNVAVVALDANDASFEIPANLGWLGDAQDRWLDRTLKALRADPRVDFVVVTFHHCAYSTNAGHASDAGVRTRWTPLFDRHGVDLVVNGHNHGYERTHPLRAGQAVAQAPTGSTVEAAHGTTYVTAGGGGQTGVPVSLFPASFVFVEGGLREPETALWSAARHMDLSVLVADVDPGRGGGTASMRLRAVKPDGTVVDDVTLRRTARAAR